ncbi:TetR/AcrR family transcriptional regulator [Salinibacterium hongtaonis]|uniref:TetR family transcriptional regulator n=1 Tax=Homoserinimonas hongtaonis TaxID=2079791 RepID=A0A2U1T253_9MICO|nr:TetR/AcrR family transcriptional regulator [Salinibacterium hongtaonis]PWB97959.1 TetR family transcriptional regulator [Salinibacterium hongtaonis]
MRADAALRRQAIVREARRLFAEHGAMIALETIAEASGVGIATLYRNFDSRAALADEVALAILSDMREASSEALITVGSQAESAWRDYIDRLVELDLGALTAALSGFVAAGMSESVRDAQAQTLSGVEEVLAAAQSAGLVRTNFGALELIVGIGMITRPQLPAIHEAAPSLTSQLVDIFVTGMRPTADPS